MAVILHKLKRNLTIVLMLIWCLNITFTIGHRPKTISPSIDSRIDRIWSTIHHPMIDVDHELTNVISIKRDHTSFVNSSNIQHPTNATRNDSFLDRVGRFARSHRVEVNLSKVFPVERSLPTARLSFGKNSFLTGFGLGFLAFGLKKLLLPIFIAAQILKSILLAMFLPSILGNFGKLVGKGVNNFAQTSGSSNFAGAGMGSENLSDFDFKDGSQTNAGTNTGNFDAESAGSDTAYNFWTYPAVGTNSILNNHISNNNMLQYQDVSHYQPQTTSSPVAAVPQFSPISSASLFGNSDFASDYTTTQTKPTAITKLTQKAKETLPNKLYSGSFYSKDKTEDFKVFHNIPSSSHLLANYDPFYSPLLSRLDSVFKQLAHSSEACRERLVCNMYKNPAKYAPFSNLVSAQLSRELNELRKPSSDNPEILRFFKYMKAAKDGQDGQECDVVYSECTTTRSSNENAPMVSTYNDINKLVQARSL